MNYLVNTTQHLYYKLEDFATAQAAAAAGDIFNLLFALDIETLFEKLKRRSALRGKLAKDAKTGVSMFDDYQMTEDERDFYLEFLKIGSTEVFQKIMMYSRLINGPYRYNVNFGEPLLAGTVTTDAGTVLTDSTKTMTPDAYIGKKLIIMTGGLYENQEREIDDNNATTFTLETAFGGTNAVLNKEYVVATTTTKNILIFSHIDITKCDFNVLLRIDGLLERSFIGCILREWYLINKFADDYAAEVQLYEKTLEDLLTQYFKGLKPWYANLEGI